MRDPRPISALTIPTRPPRAGRLKRDRLHLVTSPLLILLLGALFATRTPDPASLGAGIAPSPVLLPVEVIGPDGYVASVTLDVPDPSEADRLYLRVHRPAYRDASTNPTRGPKASVRLNGNAWVGLTNETVEAFAHEAAYGGLNGGLHTLRLTVPLSTLGPLQPGPNTLSFRFNGTDGLTVGYRVLEFNLLRPGGSAVLPPDAFVEDDPSGWEPISNAPADIAAGEALWNTAALVEAPDGPPSLATCGGCHAQDGRDLWYFAYSNRSIVERSKFHGLSQHEAEQVASYIRSLQDRDPSYAYAPPGRPWNPPYQPGPGLDALPAHRWAAGAGLEWVLEEDEDMVPFIFPDGITKEAIATTGTLNMREIPRSLQFPDWNEWLPTEHPVDIWGDTFTNDPLYLDYLHARAALEGNPEAPNRAQLVGEIAREATAFWRQRGSQAPYRANGDTPEVARRHRSQYHWATVKTWEVMHEFDLEDDAAVLHAPFGEARSWFRGERLIFELAPHLATDKRAASFPWQDDLVGKYFSTAWYEAQLVINNGNVSFATAISPVDWNYQPAHIADLGRAAYGGPKHPVRQLLTFAKMNQIFHHYEEQNGVGPFGVAWGQAHPGRYNPNHDEIWDGIAPATLALLYDAVIGAFMDRIEAIPHAAWPRLEDSDGDGAYCDEPPPPYLKPPTWNGDPDLGPDHCSHGWGDVRITQSQSALAGRRFAEYWYQMIPVYRTAGVSEPTLTRLIDWGEAMWPLGEWDALRIEAADEDHLHLLSGWNFVASRVAPAAPGMPAVVGGLDGIVMVKDVSGRHFIPAYGVHDLAVWNPTQAYEVLVEDDATLTVRGTALDPAQTPIPLHAGWNYVPYFLGSPRAVEDAFAPILEVLNVVNDGAGGVYDPSTGTDTIEALQPGRGYKVHVAADTVLVYPAD